MKYSISFSQYGIDLPTGLKTKDELINAYAQYMGGTQAIFDYFLKYVNFFEDNIKDGKIIENIDNDTGSVLQEVTN